ncbi:tRNA pseudouridine(38-40) synthase [Orientia tsutsugamushi str. Gilliam]|uniref:tRNA pseudouridine synthase A n=1 Tax=Orientia tsutsugamushi str. Gilliam TaxID=1359184 RepID=A0A0F3MAA1_ORITS|nr:tRNA pseudouridine(38-40) synthase TruA [Orientia tsutsugamushi]KJV52417.1 tRNA pseudouridine(38-40) synthase [Orientia tsutsugamushi str. Gilliam]SPR07347.1 tRNA pseudouridine(38-40) synthase TruA [Orientia tsutsugamushi str. Gilliam]
MLRYKAIVEYDGTNFVGWQRQQNGLSIQQLLEDKISTFTKQTVNLIAAGRTDAGVHALGQVVHFDLIAPNNSKDLACINKETDNKEVSKQNNTTTTIDSLKMLPCRYNAYKLMSAVNYLLKPHRIILTSCEITTLQFHARFSAKARHYKYRIINRAVPSVIEQNRTWWIKPPLNVIDMIDASQHLIGKHDFTSFRSSACQSKSPLKTLTKIEVDTTNYPEIQIYFSAPSFLHHMVRNIVGTLVYIGLCKISPAAIKTILFAKNRAMAGPTAPSSGLYFIKVDY